MKFSTRASLLYPGVPWTGQSEIHVSVANTLMEVPPGNPDVAAQAVSASKMGQKLYAQITSKFHKFEWLLTDREFNAIMVNDVHRHLKGLGDTQNKTKIRNPVTGNVFHLIGRDKDMVAGVRFWIEDGYTDTINFRVRLTTTPEDIETTRVRIRTSSEEAVTELELVGIDLDIAEPPQEQAEEGEKIAAVITEE